MVTGDVFVIEPGEDTTSSSDAEDPCQSSTPCRPQSGTG